MALNIPRTITAGDSVTWDDTIDGFSTVDYSLTWALRGATALDLTALSIDDFSFRTRITAVQSAGFNPGFYYWQAVVTEIADNTQRTTIGSGHVEVLPNLSAVSGTYDGRSTAEKQLAAVESTIQSRLNGTHVDRYSIGGRELWRTPLSELTALRDQLRSQVAREQSAAGNGANPTKLFIKFGGG